MTGLLTAAFAWQSRAVVERHLRVHLRNWHTAFLPPALEPVTNLLAFGLGPHIDRWFRSFAAPDAVRASHPGVIAAAAATGSSGGSSGWSGGGPQFGGGSWGGGGAGGSWSVAAAGLAAGVSAPSSSGSGGGGGGGSSGGGGGGGW